MWKSHQLRPSKESKEGMCLTGSLLLMHGQLAPADENAITKADEEVATISPPSVHFGVFGVAYCHTEPVEV
jgi:hypothetical protein